MRKTTSPLCCLFYQYSLHTPLVIVLVIEGNRVNACPARLLCVIAYKSNPFVIWTLIHHSTFSEAVDHLDEMEVSVGEHIETGGVLEALEYFYGSVLISVIVLFVKLCFGCVVLCCCELLSLLILEVCGRNLLLSQ